MKFDLMQLKSGTDIRGIALDTVTEERVNLTDDVIERISIGFAVWLRETFNKNYLDLTVSVGHDSRLSANRIKNILISTLSGLGIKIFDCGLASTPAMFMTTVDLGCDAAIEITASHHPFNRNGFKFFTKSGGLDSCDVEKILIYASKDEKTLKDNKPNVKKINYMDVYSKNLRKMICDGVNISEENKPLKGVKIIVDAGNGAGGFYATDVLEPLGADITGSQFLNPDGRFPNHVPNPENKVAMESIVDATIKSNADLGLIFDTDVDRAGLVDNNGREIAGNSLIALASYIALKGNQGGTIVTDSITSDGLHDFLEKHLNAVHNRFKRGYKNVINEAKRLNSVGVNCPLAIETSGHAAMRENYFLDDGAYLVTKIIIEMLNFKRQDKNLFDVLKHLKKPYESIEYRLKIVESDFKEYGQKIIEDLYVYAKDKTNWNIVPDNQEGIRVFFPDKDVDGWFLLRMSVHDPVMPLNIESNIPGGMNIIISEVMKFIKNYGNLDYSCITM